MNHLTSTCIADDYIVCVHAGNQFLPFAFRDSILVTLLLHYLTSSHKSEVTSASTCLHYLFDIVPQGVVATTCSEERTMLRQRQQPPTSSSTPIQSELHPSKEGVKLPWYQYPLNLILARTLRFLGKFGYYLHNKRYKPNGIPVTRIKKVKMRDGYEVILHIYEPSPPPSTTSHRSQSISSSRSELRPCVINFHGGGFTIGSGTDDSRWAHWCTRTSGPSTTGYTTEASRTSNSINTTTEAGNERGLGAIYISIEYRLSPEYPHPTPVDDCIDSTLYIIKHAKEFGIDKDKVFLSGFSAGGSLAVTTALAFISSSPLDSSHTSLPNSNTTTTTTTTTKTQNQIAGVIAFYPVLDFNTPRSIKRQRALAYANSNSNSNSRGKVTPLPGWMTRMFDTSYLPPQLSLDRMDPMISPGLAPSCKLETFPNLHLILCGADVLANEGREFGERLRNGEREVVVRTVPGARHGWDKPPLPLQSSVGEEYDAAIESMIRWCQ
jgi:acetyl esterase/lipase